LNKETYRNKAVSEYYRIADTYRAQRRIILDNEAHQPTINLKITNLKKDASSKLRTLIKGLEDTAKDAEKVAQAAHIKAMRQGKDAARAGYVQINAVNAFDGLTGDEIAEKYPSYIASLHPDDKPYRWVIDELVLNKARDKGTEEVLKHLIWQNLSADEKIAAGQLEQAKDLDRCHKTITGLMEMDLEDIGRGGERPSFDVADTFDQLASVNKNNVTEVKINPAE
jgi:hypothetical protein